MRKSEPRNPLYLAILFLLTASGPSHAHAGHDHTSPSAAQPAGPQRTVASGYAEATPDIQPAPSSNPVPKQQDTTAPYGYLDIPGPGAPTSIINGILRIEGWARDDGSGVKAVRLMIDGNPGPLAVYGRERPDLGGNFGLSWEWNTKLVRDGYHLLTMKITDNAGNINDLRNTAAYRRGVIIDNTPPRGNIEAPPPNTNGFKIHGIYTIRAWLADDLDAPAVDVKQVEILVDGTPMPGLVGYPSSRFFKVNNRAGLFCDWDTTTVSDGLHTIQLRAVDSVGNVTNIDNMQSFKRIVNVVNTLLGSNNSKTTLPKAQLQPQMSVAEHKATVTPKAASAPAKTAQLPITKAAPAAKAKTSAGLLAVKKTIAEWFRSGRPISNPRGASPSGPSASGSDSANPVSPWRVPR